ncbi:MAG TPA: PLP-dependent aminotransferase family protein [Candidatus Angelobacter sp.]|nr:PLP-dependent aminotransferase family protein [Candidatus Angelobacter sp.]
MVESRTSSAPELLLPLRRGTGEPLGRQLERQLRDAIRDGRLAPAGVLPSTRALARQLGVARGVVVAAYEQLVAEGYLVSRPGATTSVARVPRPAPPAATESLDEPFPIDFRPGRPDVREFPRDAWLRSLRRALDAAPATAFGYLDGRGAPELRTTLASYLNRARGTCIAPGDMVISTGFAQGIQLVSRALAGTGRRRIGVEDPYHPEYRAMIAASGLEVVGVPVDRHGLELDHLDRLDLDAVVVTPAHQFPTGGVLPPERRARLVAWAARRDAIIVEDDYDAEFRYDRDPIGAVQGLCSDRVVYAGTASKMLAPGIRLGWLAIPRRLVEAVAAAKTAADHGSAVMDQLALADFIERGELDRHLRRMRPIYRRRRDALLDALAEHLPALEPTGASAGLHVLAWLPEGIDERLVVAQAESAGIGLTGVAWCCQARPVRRGIVFGYAAMDERRIVEGVKRLAGLVSAARG